MFSAPVTFLQYFKNIDENINENMEQGVLKFDISI